MYIYLMNVLFICHMLWAHDASNILEYKRSLKLLTINRRTDRENKVYLEETKGLLCAKKFSEDGCQHVVQK